MSAGFSIQILLATYNGARFLPEMIRSLEGQTEQDFEVLVRDDGSSDGTQDIILRWADRNPGRVRILPTAAPSGSAMRNFDILLQQSQAPYVLFADQDDVWQADKVARTWAALRQGEAQVGVGRPVLAFSDLRLVDEVGSPICGSFWRFRKVDARRGIRFQRLLLDNLVTGCAMGINSAARQRCGSVPDRAMMHDWWLALVCAAFGTLVPIPDALIDYRQHGGNSVGAAPWTAMAALRTKLKSLSLRGDQHIFDGWYQGVQAQAAAFESCFAADLAPEKRAALAAFVRLRSQGLLARRWQLLRHGLFQPGLVRNAGLLLRI